MYKKLWSLFTATTSEETVESVAKEMTNLSAGQEIWPFITFLLVACIGPYFIYKMFPDVTGGEYFTNLME